MADSYWSDYRFDRIYYLIIRDEEVSKCSNSIWLVTFLNKNRKGDRMIEYRENIKIELSNLITLYQSVGWTNYLQHPKCY